MEAELMELLDNVAKRPAMYVGRASFEMVRAYLGGLRAALEWNGIKYTWDDYFAAGQARGWDPRGSTGIERDFREHGLPEDEMIRELVAVEKDAYTQALRRPGK